VILVSKSAYSMTITERQWATVRWCMDTIPGDVDLETRLSRFLEEATELCQAGGLSRERAHKIVDYVMDRPDGVPAQEVGGVMVTLAVAASMLDVDIDGAWAAELERIHEPEVVEKVKRRQQEKREAGL
jgi:hypothetical protein